MAILSKNCNRALIRNALPYIPSDDRDIWIRVGMSLKSELDNSGFAIWDQWSRTSDRYNERDARAAWKSFKPGGGITIGTIIYLARQNGWRLSRASIRNTGKTLPQTKLQRKGTSQKNDLRIRKALRKVWCRSVPINDPSAEIGRTYLRKRLGVNPDPLPNDLRFIHSLAYWEDGHLINQYPTLLAVIRDPNGRPITMHRTYLQPDGGGKAKINEPKKLMSCLPESTVSGGAIRLYEPTDQLATAEGIESALAIYVALRVPVWSGINAGCLPAIFIPHHVKLVIIAGDHDPSGRGQQAVERLKRRLLCEGRRVKVLMPEIEGDDWCDVLMRIA